MVSFLTRGNEYIICDVARFVAENPITNDRVGLPSPANTVSAPSKTESGGFARKQSLRDRPLLDYPMPDYSKVKPKVNTYLYNTPIKGSGNKEVSGVVTYCMIQMKRGTLLE
jgi:hypothetical protein